METLLFLFCQDSRSPDYVGEGKLREKVVQAEAEVRRLLVQARSGDVAQGELEKICYHPNINLQLRTYHRLYQ